MFECGALCTDSEADCATKVGNIVNKVISLAVSIGASTMGSIDIIGILAGMGSTA